MPDSAPSPADAESLLLAAEEAEAEAVAAEARARAVRLRRQARAAGAEDPVEVPGSTEDPGSTEVPGSTEIPGSTASTDSESERQAGDTRADTGPEHTDTTAPAAATTAPAGRRKTLAAAGSVAVICAAVAVSAYVVWHHADANDRDRRAAEFEAAARQGVVTLTTLDFNNADADVQRVLDNSTGEFRDDFQNRAQDFVGVIQQSNVATEGTIDASAVESMTDDSAVVLVSATSKVTNAAGADQEPRVWRLSVTVTREGEQSKMSKVEFVP